ncbi:type IV secretion system DNA-binding domain-containing protein [Nocardia otitidiscaviarum]|uniref:type IV secretion system DNA-binding domain-containing protein n=1 Tax=Nocardia otitidiscaviarum TaxID=1823 RepID=UPI0024551672|nr:type IV secretion system DNA-binding domain-containing protein [Nocardia otitidiscaviarum]
MSNHPCVPLITPTDCGPTPVPLAAPTPAPDPIPPIGPQTPPVVDEVADPVTGPGGPDWSSAAAEIATTSVVCGLVLVGMLILIVGVAALRPVDPHRLRNFAAAAWALPAVSALTGGSWSTPASLLWDGATDLAAGDLAGLSMMLVLGLPAALLAASLWWASFLIKTNTVGLKSLRRTKRVQDALTARRSRAAARAAKHGAPLHRGHDIVLGTLADRVNYRAVGVWRSLTQRHEPWLAVPYRDAKRQQALFGSTGSGKTELIKRYSTALFDYEWRAWQRWDGVPGMSGKHPRPLLVIIPCKGGEDDRVFGIQTREAMIGQGVDPARIALVVPEMDRLDFWVNTPARDLRAIVAALMSSGSEATTAEGQHFGEMQTRIAHLVVDAPCGPPASTTELRARLNPEELKRIWNYAPDVVREIDAMQEEKVPQIDDALIKFSNLIESLKDHNGQVVFDGGRSIDDLDVLFMTVPALDKDAARAQVSATLRLLMQRAGRTAKAQRRSVILFIDELSALTTVKGSIGIEDVAERGRSQGVAMVFSGQSPESIAGDQWSLNRLLKTCAGGVLLGYLENAGELCKHFGSIPVMLPSRHLIKGQRHGDEGQVSVGEKWLVDPDRVRQFDTGEFVFVKAGRARYGRVVPLTPTDRTRLPGTTPTPATGGTSPATT